MNPLSQAISQAQCGVLSDPSSCVEYLTFSLMQKSESSNAAIGSIKAKAAAIAQQDPQAQLSYTIGFSEHGWEQLFTDKPQPASLKSFVGMEDGPRRFPATAGDIFIMIKSERQDLNFQLARVIKEAFLPFAELIEDVQAYKYRENRDMIDFVDGTENPEAEERAAAVLVDDDTDYIGGSYLTIQRYIEDLSAWNATPVAEQEKVIGRTKDDDIELSGDDKPAYAHTKKSVVKKEGGGEIKMFRQNRPYGNAMEHGTMFVGFAKDPNTIETSLRQMITADEDGNYDRLLDFATAVTGNLFFVPPQGFLDSL